MTTRVASGRTYNLAYEAENRLVSVTGASTANFYYDADGKQVKTVVNGVTTYYVGNHYEVKNSVVTKYYFAGATRLAVRTGTTLSYLLSDHIGSSSVTTDANGVKTASALYKAFGETRFSSGNLGTDYKFTGQREEASLGIYYFNARWMDPSLGRFTSPDSIVPTSTQGTQAWDRYAFVNNNPVRYNDPTGHDISGWCGTFCSNLAKAADWVGVAAATVEAVAVDAFAEVTIPVGCATVVGCGAAIALAVDVDIVMASYANPLGGLENAAGVVSLLATAADDTSNGSTYIASNDDGGLSVGIGQNTIVSATTTALGHIPESNLDLILSAGQLVYDYTIGEETSNTWVQFNIPPPPDLWGDPSDPNLTPPACDDSDGDLVCD
jgi:RHS repeat-associated protein